MNKSLVINLNHLLFCLILIGVCSNLASAYEVTRQSTIEIEKTAEQKGKIWNGEEIRRSIVLYLKASENWENLGDLERSSHCLRESAKLSFLVSENKDVLLHLNKALRLDLKTNNIDGQVITHSLLSRFHSLSNQEKKSAFHIDKAIKLSESSSYYSKAFLYHIAGIVNLNIGEIIEATKLLTKAYEFVEKVNDTNLKADILLNLGMLSAIEGDKDKGLKQINEANDLWKTIDSKRGLALVSNALGFVYVITDEKQKALKSYKRADALIPLDVDYTERAKMYSGIATVYYYYRYFELAEKNTLSALEWQKKAKNTLGQLGVLTELGNTQYLGGKITESRFTYEKANSMAKNIKSTFYLGVLNLYSGQTDLAEGNIDLAIEKFKKANNAQKNLGLKLPRIDNLLGKAYQDKGEFENSRAYFKSAAKISRETKDTIQLAEALNGLANLLKIEGKIKEAFEKSAESIQLTETFYNDVGSNNLRERFFSSIFERYDLYINLLMQMHESSPNKGFDLQALKASEKSRSRLMRENLQLAMNNITIDADPQNVEKEKELTKLLTTKKVEMTTLLSKEYEQKDVDTLNLEITQIEDDLHSTQALLKDDSPIYASIQKSVEFDIEKLQKDILDEQTVLLEFFFGKEKSYVWLIGKNELNVYTLPNNKTIEIKLKNLLKMLVSIEELPNDNVAEYQTQLARIEATYWIKAAEISNILFNQFSDKLQDKRIIIVPDGKLRSFPVSALPFPNSNENKPFLISNEIVYEPSASLLYLLKTERKNSSDPQKDFLVFSDPIFAKNDERLENQFKSFKAKSSVAIESPFWTDFDSMSDLEKLERLKASENESKNIFKFYNPNNSKVISGFNANRTNLLSENLWDYKVLHFATHGLFNEEVPELSGIVLSRFDEKGNKQNGLIWLQDIYGLKLSTDLVVLSACDTGVGKEIKGEGLMSLTNGFLQAGAKSIISSRWKVDDDRTLELMNNFYRILAEENITPSKALQKAKIKMYNNPNNRFPFYWASFTFHGDYQNKPNLSTKTNYTDYLIFVFFALVLLGIYVLIKKPYKQKIT